MQLVNIIYINMCMRTVHTQKKYIYIYIYKVYIYMYMHIIPSLVTRSPSQHVNIQAVNQWTLSPTFRKERRMDAPRHHG